MSANGIVLYGWDGTRLGTIGEPGEALACVSVSASGELVLVGSADRAISVWSVGGRKLADLVADGRRTCGAISANEKFIVTGSRDGSARLWNSAGTELAKMEHTDPVLRASISPSGDRLLVFAGKTSDEFGELVRFDGAISVWDIGDLREPRLLWRKPGHISAAFSPDGDTILTPSPSRFVHLYDLHGEEVVVLRGHADDVVDVDVSPSGSLMATASLDRSARIWNLNGQVVAVLGGHTQSVAHVAFSHSGKQVVTTSLDGTARTWLVHPDDLLDLAERRIMRDFTPGERKRYAELLGEAPASEAGQR